MGRPAKTDPLKYCGFCQRLMKRKRYNGRMEDMAVFLRRRYCDSRCMGDAKVTHEPALATLRSRARREVERKLSCEACRGTAHLQRHHVNRDKTDNRPENVQTLCASCHAKEHWRNEKRQRYSARSDVGTVNP